MWPGQQPPGGEQNPQDQNPNPYQQPGFQQPGHQQPNPYQQGQPPAGQPQGAPPQQGYQQPNPYQQPTVPQYAATSPPGAPRPPDDGRRRTTIIAIVAAAAVVATAVITGVVVFKDDGGNGRTARADDKKLPTASVKPAAPVSLSSNPRAGGEVTPVIAGWKAVVNPKWGTAFDVPPDWEVASSGLSSGFEDDKGKPLIIQSAPAFFKSKWCTDDANKDGNTEDTGLGGAGTKGANGAKSTQEVAENQVAWWVYGAYTQPNKKLVKTSKSKPYTTKSGVTGSLARAWATGVPKKSKCTTDGQAITFGFKNSKGDFVAFSLYNSTGVKGALGQGTIDKILSTVRLAGDPTGPDAG